MEISLVRLLQSALAISLSVLLHKGGYMFFAKFFGARVEKFFVSFDVGIGKWRGHLFSFKPKRSDTTYGMGWLPLSGYCKIAGMIDESFDTEQIKKPVEPWEFRSKPAQQHPPVMIGGVTVNFLLALLIYSMALLYWGESYVLVKNVAHGIRFNQEAKSHGFQNHDILLGTDQGAFRDSNADAYRDLSTTKRVDIIRNGKHMSINLPGDLSLLSMLKSASRLVIPSVLADIGSVIPDGAAAKVGVKKGDRIAAINGKSVDSWNAFQGEVDVLNNQLMAAKTSQDSMKVRTASTVFIHPGTLKADTAQVLLGKDLLLGVGVTSAYPYYQPTKKKYGFFEGFSAGAKCGRHALAGYASDTKYVFTADGAKSLGGFGIIGSLFPPVRDQHIFWPTTAFLSIILVFMNIFPVPALDGGHVLLLLYEVITRRKSSEVFMICVECIGIGILLLLMIAANLNDVLR